jgi:hypothetical protein
MLSICVLLAAGGLTGGYARTTSGSIAGGVVANDRLALGDRSQLLPQSP